MCVLGKDIQTGEHRRGMDSSGDGDINSVPSAPQAWRMDGWMGDRQ